MPARSTTSAHVAQSVEHFLGKEEVTDSSSVMGSIFSSLLKNSATSVERPLPHGEVPEWLKGADCKSAGYGLRGFESLSHHH
jgi:hypothetical protein